MLLTDGGDAARRSPSRPLKRLDPRGSDLSKDAQVIRIGQRAAAARTGSRRAVIEGDDPYERAAAVDRFASAATRQAVGERDRRLGRAGASARCPPPPGPRARATRSCSSKRDEVPAATRARRSATTRSRTSTCSARETVISQEGVEGSSASSARCAGSRARPRSRTRSRSPATSAASFGWGVDVPGYNFTVANTERPLDARRGRALAATRRLRAAAADRQPDELPRPLDSYFLDVQPGYEDDPRRGRLQPRLDPRRRRGGLGRRSRRRIDEVTELVPVQANAP